MLDEPQEVVDYVDGDLAGNGPLLQQALQAHGSVLDGWETNGVDVRALVGTGLNTPVGVDLLPGQGTFAPDAAELRFGNGDETVPRAKRRPGDARHERSARRGHPDQLRLRGLARSAGG